MGKIQQLSPHVADLIAAGEVVERPASAAKELVENAIDAGATRITVELQEGGMRYLRVTDNGCGMSPEDACTAFLRHATSKLREASQLEAISTLGFRGEALAAISAVSRVDLLTRTPESDFGTSVHLEAGTVTEQSEAGCPVGTTIIVRDLFYNTPARMKFMKRDSVEAAALLSTVQRLALAHPEIAFHVLRDGEEQLRTVGDGELRSAIFAVLGKTTGKDMLSMKSAWDSYSLSGFLSTPIASRGNRGNEIFFVNGRFVRSKTMTAALEEAYRNRIMVGRFPSCVLHLHLPEHLVDVNVHPAKTEVKFLNEKDVFDCIHYGVKGALDAADGRVELRMKNTPSTAEGKAVPREDFYRNMSAEQFRQYAKLLKEAPVPQGKPAEQSARWMFDGAATLHAPRPNKPSAQNTAMPEPIHATESAPVQNAEISSLHYAAKDIPLQSAAEMSALSAENKAPLSKSAQKLQTKEASGVSNDVYPPENFKVDRRGTDNFTQDPEKGTAFAAEGVSPENAAKPSSLHAEEYLSAQSATVPSEQYAEGNNRQGQQTQAQSEARDARDSLTSIYPPENFKVRGQISQSSHREFMEDKALAADGVSPENATRLSPLHAEEYFSAQSATVPSEQYAEGNNRQGQQTQAQSEARDARDSLSSIYPPENFKVRSQISQNSHREFMENNALAAEGVSPENAAKLSPLHATENISAENTPISTALHSKEDALLFTQKPLQEKPNDGSYAVHQPEYFKANRRNTESPSQDPEKRTSLAAEGVQAESAQESLPQEPRSGSHYVYPPEHFKVDKHSSDNGQRRITEADALAAEVCLHESAQVLPESTQSLSESTQMLSGSAQSLSGSAQSLSGSAQSLSGSAQMLSSSAQSLSGSAQILSNSAQIRSDSAQIPALHEQRDNCSSTYPPENIQTDRQNAEDAALNPEQMRDFPNAGMQLASIPAANPSDLQSSASMAGLSSAEASQAPADASHWSTSPALRTSKTPQAPPSQAQIDLLAALHSAENFNISIQNTYIMKTGKAGNLSSEQQTLPLEEPAYRIVGETMNTYILVELGETLLFIDKHAAHERILFEKFRQSPEPVMPQLMLQPILCTLGGEEAALLLENERFLSDFGFALSDFGDGVVSVSQIPAELPEDQVEATLSQLAADLQKGKRTEPDALRDTLLHTLSCKAAIKGGWHSDPRELETLVAQVMSRDDLKYCPHGRPICASLTRGQLERQFKRS